MVQSFLKIFQHMNLNSSLNIAKQTNFQTLKFSENRWNSPKFRALNFKNYRVPAQTLLMKVIYQWTLYNFFVDKFFTYAQISKDKASQRLVVSALQTETKFQRNVLNFEAL